MTREQIISIILLNSEAPSCVDAEAIADEILSIIESEKSKYTMIETIGGILWIAADFLLALFLVLGLCIIVGALIGLIINIIFE